MNASSRSLAVTLVGWCAALLPADRAIWGAAMKAEMDMIADDGAALSFAFGCLWGSIKQRIFTLIFAARSVRVGMIGAMVALSLLSAITTKRMIDAHAECALIFALTSALFAAAARLTCLRGSIALVQAACLVIPLYLLAYAFLSSGHAMAGGWDDARLYRAVAIEGVVIWATFLMGALFVRRVEALPITRRM